MLNVPHVDIGKIITKSNLTIHQALYSVCFIGSRRFGLFLHFEMKKKRRKKKYVGRLGEHLKYGGFIHQFV